MLLLSLATFDAQFAVGREGGKRGGERRSCFRFPRSLMASVLPNNSHEAFLFFSIMLE